MSRMMSHRVGQKHPYPCVCRQHDRSGRASEAQEWVIRVSKEQYEEILSPDAPAGCSALVEWITQRGE